MTYQECVQTFVKDRIKENGSLRKMASHYGVDPAVLSKIQNGKYIPKMNTMTKMFPEIEFLDVEEPWVLSYSSYEPKFEIKCKSLDELKDILDGLGYEITITKKGS